MASSRRFGLTAWSPVSWAGAIKLFQALAQKGGLPEVWHWPADFKSPPSVSWVKDTF